MGDVVGSDIVEGIRSLGVAPGDVLLAHSSLKSFGRFEGGANAVAEALIESVSPGGTVVVPTFNYGQLPYDPRTTQSLTGAITDAFWRLPVAVRSNHPTHSFAAIGPLAAELMRGHGHGQTLGRGSPLGKVWERGAWVLLIGVDHRANSMIHLAEDVMDVPYLDRTRVARLLRRGNEVTDVTVRRPGCSHGFDAMDEPMRRTGKVREATVGQSRLMLMPAETVVAVAADLLRHNPAALLCERSDCDRCAWARERINERQSRSY